MELDIPRHVLLHYPLEIERKEILRESRGGRLDFIYHDANYSLKGTTSIP
jgi:hypothetical protein